MDLSRRLGTLRRNPNRPGAAGVERLIDYVRQAETRHPCAFFGDGGEGGDGRVVILLAAIMTLIRHRDWSHLPGAVVLAAVAGAVAIRG